MVRQVKFARCETLENSAEIPWLNARGDSLILDVVVVPRASRTRVMGVDDKRLKIQLIAPQVDGKGNDALVRFLADVLDIPKAQIEIVGGAANKAKTVRLDGLPFQKALLRLNPASQQKQ